MEPRLTIVRGDPTPEEVAALVTVLTARLRPAGHAKAGEAPRYGWSSRSRMLRIPISRGPGAWRASALPH
jgi:Acyl-CoA carboxylase epsilon subunit